MSGDPERLKEEWWIARVSPRAAVELGEEAVVEVTVKEGCHRPSLVRAAVC